MTVTLADVLALLPRADRKHWLGSEVLAFRKGWIDLGLPVISYDGARDKEAIFVARDTAGISRRLRLSGKPGVGITFEHNGYQARIVQADEK